MKIRKISHQQGITQSHNYNSVSCSYGFEVELAPGETLKTAQEKLEKMVQRRVLAKAKEQRALLVEMAE
jgi:hypothetical protein